MEELPPRRTEAEIVLHPCPHCGQLTHPGAARCARCRKRLRPMSPAQRVGAWLMLAIFVFAGLAAGAVLVASCSAALIVSLVVVPVLGGAWALLRRTKR